MSRTCKNVDAIPAKEGSKITRCLYSGTHPMCQEVVDTTTSQVKGNAMSTRCIAFLHDRHGRNGPARRNGCTPHPRRSPPPTLSQPQEGVIGSHRETRCRRRRLIQGSRSGEDVRKAGSGTGTVSSPVRSLPKASACSTPTRSDRSRESRPHVATPSSQQSEADLGGETAPTDHDQQDPGGANPIEIRRRWCSASMPRTMLKQRTISTV